MKLADILVRLESDGLILLADALFPSLVGLVTGESIKGSWWGHARGNEIYNLANEVEDHGDVLVTKLVSGKVTFVHRRLWPAVIGIGQANATWQLKDLSPVARALLKRVEREGEVRPEALVADRSARAASFGKFITELEKRLLIQSAQIHTESGAHARVVYSWETWANVRDFKTKPLVLSAATAALEAVVETLNHEHKAKGKLPW